MEPRTWYTGLAVLLLVAGTSQSQSRSQSHCLDVVNKLAELDSLFQELEQNIQSQAFQMRLVTSRVAELMQIIREVGPSDMAISPPLAGGRIQGGGTFGDETEGGVANGSEGQGAAVIDGERQDAAVIDGGSQGAPVIGGGSQDAAAIDDATEAEIPIDDEAESGGSIDHTQIEEDLDYEEPEGSGSGIDEDYYYEITSGEYGESDNEDTENEFSGDFNDESESSGVGPRNWWEKPNVVEFLSPKNPRT